VSGKSQPTAVSKILAFSRKEVTRFYDNLRVLFEMYEFGCNHIFSVDESEILCMQNLLQSLVVKVKNRLGLPQVSSEGETLLFAVP
jgi:hypothetical protein